MTQLDLKKIVEAETRAIEEMEVENTEEKTFTCPNCGGTALVRKHPKYGYTSHCENGCFSSRQ
jgi:predicted RNA-binding Zn-ribbon protein involved in translation (DUF1610 family)